MRRLPAGKWTAVALLSVLALVVGVHEFLAAPTVTLTYTAPEAAGTLFARLSGEERDRLLFATLQHVRSLHPEDRARWLSGRSLRILPGGGVAAKDTPAMHDRFRVYLTSLSDRGAVETLASLPAERRVTLRLQLVDAGAFHREVLNQDAGAELVCDAISRRLLGDGDRLTRYPGTGAAEITTTVRQVQAIGPLLDEVKWNPPPYPTLASLYDATNTAHYFETARESVEPASRFWLRPEYPSVAASLSATGPLTLDQRERLRTFLGTWGKGHYALLSGARLSDLQYKTLPDRDPFNAWTGEPVAEHLARLLWMRAVLDASEGKPIDGAGAAAMAIFWADRLERGESPYYLSTPAVRAIGCRAFSAMLRSASPAFTTDEWRALLGLFALRMAPYEKPWPEGRFLPAERRDPLERFVNQWRRAQERRYWQRWRFSQSMVDLLRVEIALEIYRLENPEYPERLSRLAPGILPAVPQDTLHRRDFVYKTDGLTFQLYSLGYDGKDDGGALRCDPDDPDSPGDWSWRVGGT
ncbi:hypothetical protein HS125_03635 [bacterium]|nr:hypothetical protein [bacterium]